MERIASKTVFAVGDRDYRWADVILASHLSGEYAELERRVRAGIACLAEGGDPPEADVDEASEAWRYDRDLLAADDLQQWLDDHALDTDEWFAYVSRSVAHERLASKVAAVAKKRKVADGDVAAALYAEALCSGTLGSLAERLAGEAAVFDRLESEGGRAARCTKVELRAAIGKLPAAVRKQGSPGIGPGELVSRAETLACLAIVYKRFVDTLVSPGALDRELSDHRLDWTTIVCDVASFGSEEAAREAVLLVREDNFTLAEAARLAKSTSARERYVLDDVPSSLRDRLVGARPGELVAPVTSGDEYLVLAVVDRVEPSTRDKQIRRRAAERIVVRTIQREIEKRVRWYERL